MIGTRCPPELVDELDRYIDLHDFSGRSDALRELIKKEMRDHRASHLRWRDPFVYAPIRATLGMGGIILGTLTGLVGFGVLALIVYRATVAGPMDPLAYAFGPAIMSMGIVFLVAPGMMIWDSARYRAADQLRLVERQSAGTELVTEPAPE